MNSNRLQQLNPEQGKAVISNAKNLLVLAGAGSGKTRVLTYRIAWLIEAQNVSPYHILAVTFTNKAANEMKERVETLTDFSTNGMWIGTFHGIAHRLLRLHHEEAKLPDNFQVIDADDQLRMLKQIIRQMNLNEEKWAAKKIQGYINAKKDQGLRADMLDHRGSVDEDLRIRLYRHYEAACFNNGVVDFAELLLRAHELLLENKELLTRYQERFAHILVDEFQDVNTIQYAFLKLLSSAHSNMIAVGDDDQSIYAWRGAQVEYLLRFQQEYSDVELIRLEQNYRSTGHILNAANALIAHNQGRLGKSLWTEQGHGDLITYYQAYNERDEAQFVINQVKKWVLHGNRRDECAILYRSNAQSRIFEEMLVQNQMPYRIYGGLRFFDRAEIKDALAYLGLIDHPDNDTALLRIINRPTRGIGDKTVTLIRNKASEKGVSLWKGVKLLYQSEELSAKAAGSLGHFIELIERLKSEIKEYALYEQIDHVIMHSGLWEMLEKESSAKSRLRLDNLEELVSVAREFEPLDHELDMPLLSAFLSHVALESKEETTAASGEQDSLQLMTLHSAKGLEFNQVFLVGLEEGLFPHRIAFENEGGVEEERRLCYVGMTRAKKKLTLSSASSRNLHGKTLTQRPSSFLKEIPDHYLEKLGERTFVTRVNPAYQKKRERFKPFVSQDDNAPFQWGQSVYHKTFGEGVVLNYEGHGSNAKVEVRFRKVGVKWLMASFL